jgi:uncharacterized protein YceH (UPF0502 family)
VCAGDIDVAEVAARCAVPARDSGDKERIGRLEAQVADLEHEVSDLKQLFEGFRKQFE